LKEETASAIGFHTMSGRVLKSCAVIALSLALLYSGAAWAVEACVRHGDHTDYAVAQDHDLPQVSLNRAHPHESVPVIHCTSASDQVGPAVRVASTEIRRSDKGVAFHAASLPGPHSAVLRNNLWLEAVFSKTAEFFLPIDLERRLFLSVFQI
jgi:hypothetical protein